MPKLPHATAACLVLLGASACQGGRPLSSAESSAPPTEQAERCHERLVADHRASSLPWTLQPRPGPAVLYAEPEAAPQLENTGHWQAPPILISGASAYRCGEFLYQDWLYDDHGAAGLPDPEDPQAASAYLFSPKAGSLSYPQDPVYANNAADLVEFRVRPLADATAFRITLNSLLDPDRVAFTIAIGDSPDVVDWPYEAGVRSPAGWFLSVKGQSVELLEAGSLQAIPGPGLQIDLLRRQYHITLPHSAWRPDGQPVRLAAGFGLWDAQGQRYLQPAASADVTTPGGAAPGGSALFNMAFRSSEPTPDFTVFSGRSIADAAVLARTQAHWWRERQQADALRDGDVSAFHVRVDFERLVQGIDDESGVPRAGFMNRIFASRFSFGQGVDYASQCGGVSAARPCDGAMIGQLQPYAVYVPDNPPPPEGYGLTLLLHALSANLNQYLGSRHARQLGERGAGSIVVTPAGRGPDGFYFDVAEADVFEVWQDVARHYPLNPERVAMSGISMGGIGSFRLATRYPDLFARIMPVVAATTSYGDLLPSLRNVPVMMWTSLFDELQNVAWTEETISSLLDLGYRLDSYRFETWDHLTPSTNDQYAPGAAFLLDDAVPRHPPGITYVLKPAEDEARVDVIADKAYWLSDLRLRDEGLGTGRIDAYSEGLGQALPDALAAVQSLGILEGGNHEPAPYTRRQLQWPEPADQPAANRLHISASNIASVTVHPQRAGLSCGAEILIDSDGPLEVSLQDC